MNYTSIPLPNIIKQDYPLTESQKECVSSWRKQLTDILDGKDKRLALIIGPCSIHDLSAATELALKIKLLSEEVKESFFIIMRTYFEKARSAEGWRGYLFDPHLDGSFDLEFGLKSAREFLLNLIKLGLPTGCEFLDPLTSPFLNDLMTWGSIGARTVQSPIHRQLASQLLMPIGFKNPTDGNLDIAIQALSCALSPQHCLGIEDSGHLSMIVSKGNSHPHLVLRGSITSPNFDPESVCCALHKLRHAGLPPYVFIDCSHDNSKKKHQLQQDVFWSAVKQYRINPKSIRGIMLENFLYAGNQENRPGSGYCLKYGVSITDSCMDWLTTERLIREAHQLFQQDRIHETALEQSLVTSLL